LIKDKYPKVTKILICFDPKKSIEKTKYNQIQYYPYGMIVYTDDKKSALDYTKLIDICNTDDISDVQYEIVITMSEYKSRIINSNKTFQFQYVHWKWENLSQKRIRVLTKIPPRLLILIIRYSQKRFIRKKNIYLD
jgi:hypothetical protein